MKKDDSRSNRNSDSELVRGASPGGPVFRSRANKNNPSKHSGILDWFYDFFVTPLINTLRNLVKDYGDVFRLLVPVTWVHDLIKQATPAADTVDRTLRPEAITSPEAAATAAPDLTKTLDKNLADLTTTLMGVEIGSAGMVDISPARAADLPPIKFLATISSTLRETWFNSGFLPYYQRHVLKQYMPFLPPYQDMISVYVREGYLEDHQVEIPREFVEYMKELGTSEFWTKRLWGKHWVLPGVELLYDMYHKKIIDYETLALMLKFHDFLPEWRGRLIENAYEMVPRVDLRRAYMYGRLSYEDLVSRYGKLGYGLGDETLMADIAQRFALEAHYSRLLTVARAAYRKGQLQGPEFQAIMEEIHIPAAAQDLILQAETLAKLSGVKDPGEEPYIPSRSDMRWMAEWGEITPEELEELAEADGIDPEWAPQVTEAWLLNQLRDELAKVRRVYEDKLEAGFMSKDAFAKELEGLHYPPHIIAIRVKWAEEALDLEEKQELVKEYDALAKDGFITVDQYGAALRDLKMVEDRITRKMNYVKRLLAVKAMKEAAKKKG